MKRLTLFSLVFFFLIFSLESTALDFKLLQIKESGSKRDKLLFNMNHVREIIADFSTDTTLNIEFANLEDKVLARLGTLKKGEIKWRHKIDETDFLLVGFSGSDFPNVRDRISSSPEKPGFQIILSDSKTNTVVKSYEIYTSPFPDLKPTIKAPIKAAPGEDLTAGISVTVTNRGTADAGNFTVGFMLFQENETPIPLGTAVKDFTGDVIIKNGKEEPRLFAPGETVTVDLNEPIILPGQIKPGKYYLGVKADAGDQIKETDEENNLERSFILISVAEPKKITLTLPKTRIVYDPKTFALNVVQGDTILSDGKDWRKCRIMPYIYQIKHRTWENFHWEIDTVDKSVWRITGAKFCGKGGSDKEIRTKVLVRGGSKTTLPLEVVIELPETQLVYEPPENKFIITSFGDRISYPQLWQACNLESHLFQFKQVNWTTRFWEVNTFTQKVKLVTTGGKFCRSGGVAAILALPLEIEQ